MTFLIHFIAGLIPVENFKFSWFWFTGSVIPDVDHIFILIYYRVFSWKKIIDYFKNEEKYAIRFKTKYIHSLLGAVILSLPIFLFNSAGGLYFFAGYLFHLLLDWPDKDVKQYFYPSKKESRGFLPISSKTERIFAYALLLLIILTYALIYFYIK